MQSALDSKTGRVGYIINKFEIDLMTHVTLEKGKIHYMLPMPDDIIPSKNLSTVRFGIKPIPRVEPHLLDYTEVPNLIGLTSERAEQLIEDKGFKMGKVSQVPSNSMPGTVVFQSLEPLSMSQPGSAIDLKLAIQREVKVPSLLTLSVEDAKTTLEAAELQLGNITERTSKSKEGTVISQSVTAGTVVAVGTAIDVVVASSVYVPVPDLVGRTLDAAAKILKGDEWKYEVESVKEDEVGIREKAASGCVIRQTPAAGEKADKTKTTIILYMLLSPQPVEGIDGIGATYGERLKKAGIGTIGGLSIAEPEDVSKATGVSDKVAGDWKAMAILHNDVYTLTGVEGIGKDEAELLVKAGNVRSIKELREAEPAQLYRTMKDAIGAKQVKVPAGFTMKEEDVKGWVKKARG